MSDFDPLEVAADWEDGPDIARAVAKAAEEHWRQALAAKDAELERVRGAVRNYLDKRAVPCLPWQELKRARNAMASAAGWTPPPDAADAGEVPHA